MSLRHGLRSFSARRRRTVSRDSSSCSVSLTISPASSSSVQRARPSGGLGAGGRHQQRLLLAAELALRAGPRLLAERASRLPSTKRRLVRYTVEPPTTDAGGDRPRRSRRHRPPAGSAPASACAPHACRRSAARSARRARLGSARPGTVHSSLSPKVEGTTDESAARAVSPAFRARLHTQAGAVPGLHLRLHAGARPAAGRSRSATPLPRHAAFGPPDGAHSRTRRPDPTPTRHRPQHRGARRPRAAATPAAQPDQLVKSSVQRY